MTEDVPKLAARGLPPLGRLLHLLAIEAAMQFSISAFNDYFDRLVDAGRPDKPVALGTVTPRQAYPVAPAILGPACCRQGALPAAWRGVGDASSGLHNPEGAFPTGLWQNSA